MTFATVNLLPRRRLEAYRGLGRLRTWGLVIAAFIGCTILVCLGARLAWGQDLRPIQGEAEAMAARTRAGEAELSAARARLREALVREGTVREVLDQPDWGALLGVVARRLGDEVVLRDVKVRGRAQPAAGTPSRGGQSSTYRLELRGLGRSQAAVGKFVSALESAAIFDRVRLLRTGREPFGSGGQAVSFDIECAMSDGGTR